MSGFVRILSILLYVLLGVSALLGVLFYAGVVSEQPFIVWTYILLGIAASAAVIFPVVYLVSNFKKAKKSLIGLVGLVLLVVIAYALASSEIPKFIGYEEFNITPSLSKNVGTGLFSMYILGFLAIVAIFYTEISKLFK